MNCNILDYMLLFCSFFYLWKWGVCKCYCSYFNCPCNQCVCLCLALSFSCTVIRIYLTFGRLWKTLMIWSLLMLVQVLAVKKIDSSLLQGGHGGKFREVITHISELRHPNISELVGYCSEQGQNMIVYEYFRNGSLHEFLHLSDDFSKPLTWNTRVKISLGTARALE